MEKKRRSKEGRKPITRATLAGVIDNIKFATSSYFKRTMFKALFLLAYHACLRAGELCCSNSTKHTLKVEKVDIVKSNGNTGINIMLESHKHSVGSNKMRLNQLNSCSYWPVNALLNFLKIRPLYPGPLFIDEMGLPIKRASAAVVLKKCVAFCGLDPSRYNFHSFCIGRAMNLALEGTPYLIIKETGR